jgi:hypothetical protein
LGIGIVPVSPISGQRKRRGIPSRQQERMDKKTGLFAEHKTWLYGIKTSIKKERAFPIKEADPFRML